MENTDNEIRAGISIDVTKYLSEDQMRSIAEKVAEEQMRKHVDKALQRRSKYGRTIVDHILEEAARIYMKEIVSEHKESFVQLCEKVYANETCDNHSDLYQRISFKIQDIADEYIDDNIESLRASMIGSSREFARIVIRDNFINTLSRKINIYQLVAEVLQEEIDRNTPTIAASE